MKAATVATDMAIAEGAIAIGVGKNNVVIGIMIVIAATAIECRVGTYRRLVSVAYGCRTVRQVSNRRRQAAERPAISLTAMAAE